MYNTEQFSEMPVIRARKKRSDAPGVVHDADYLRAILLQTVYAYAEFKGYTVTLCGLLDSYDESHEDCDPVSWLNLATDSGPSDNLIMAGYEALDAAEEILSCIASRAERQCKRALRDVLLAPAKQQMKILGRSYRISRPEIEAFVEGFFDNWYTYELSGDEDEIYESFLACVLSELGAYPL